MKSLKDKVTEMERGEIVNALEENNWVMVKAARMLGITERMIGYKIKKFGLKKVSWNQSTIKGEVCATAK
jgi:Nif-specific regulatory protein